jgi:hypothetical protein
VPRHHSACGVGGPAPGGQPPADGASGAGSATVLIRGATAPSTAPESGVINRRSLQLLVTFFSGLVVRVFDW